MSRRTKYPARTVAAARALYRLGFGPSAIAMHLRVKKEAVSAWVNQNWRSRVTMDVAMYESILAIIARGVFDAAEEVEEDVAEPAPVCTSNGIQTRPSAPLVRRVVSGSRY